MSNAWMTKAPWALLPFVGIAPLSALGFSGDIRYDTLFTLQQQGQNGSSVDSSRVAIDWSGLSRARLDFSGELMPFWLYQIRLQKPEMQNSQLDLDVFSAISTQANLDIVPNTREADRSQLPVEIAQAYTSYHGLEVVSLNLGLIPVPEVSCTELSSQPLIGELPQDAQLGTVIRSSGTHPGLKVVGQVKDFHYELGVWEQTPYNNLGVVPNPLTRTILDSRETSQSGNAATDLATAANVMLNTDGGPQLTDFHRGSIRWAYGGRVNWVADLPYNIYYSAALGYSHAPLNVPIVAAVFGGFDSLKVSDNVEAANDLDSPNYVMSSYDYLTQATFDFNWASTITQAQLGYQYQKLHWDTTQHYYTAESPPELESETAAAEAFSQTPKTSACWAQWGIIKGGRYRFDTSRGVVSGVKLSPGGHAWEFIIRGGMVLRKNIMAFLYQTGFDDFSTADQADPIVPVEPRLDLMDLIVFDDEQRYLLLLINNSGKSEEDTEYGDVSIVLPNNHNIAYQSRMIGWSAGLNYYPFENIALRLTYRFEHYQYKKEITEDWVKSLYMKNRQQLSLRCETHF